MESKTTRTPWISMKSGGEYLITDETGDNDICQMSPTHKIEVQKSNSAAIVSAINGTYGKGINPDAVEIMYNTLNALSTELDNYFASITHEDVASMGFRREIKELHSFAKAAINKAKTI